MFPDAMLANHALHFDFAKSSRFLAVIYRPPGLVAGGFLGGLLNNAAKFADKWLGGTAQTFVNGLNTASLSLQCEAAELPGYSINTVESKIHGAAWHAAATPVFNDLNLTFICAGDLWEKKFFDDWMEFILPKTAMRPNVAKLAVDRLLNIENNNRAPFTAKYREEYISNIQLIQFHETGIPSMRIRIEEAFPVSVQPMPLNWGDDGILRLNVQFKYRTWYREENVVRQIYDAFKQP